MTSKRIVQEVCISIELVKAKEKGTNMRITPINNQRQNNKPAFGMAVKRINTTGMTNLEKQAIAECMPELRKLFAKIDGDIELGRIPTADPRVTHDRFFNVLSSTSQKSNVERIAEFFPTITKNVHSKYSKIEDLKASLLRNAERSIDNYQNNSNELADLALKQSLKPKKVAVDKSIYQPTSGPSNMTPPTGD